MIHTFRLPEPGSPEVVIEASGWLGSRLRITADGVELERKGTSQTYVVPMAGGSVREFTVRDLPLGLRIEFAAGMSLVLKPKLPVWLLFVAMLPIGFVGLGSSIGSSLSPRLAFIGAMAASMIGAVAASVNLMVVGRPWTMAERAVAVILGDAVAIGIVVAGVVVLRAISS